MREDWAECTLDELVSEQGLFSDGDWVEKKDQDLDGEVRLIQLADIGDGSFRDKSNKRVTHKWAKENNCSFLKEGDILIARMPDPLGRATIFPLKGEEKYITAVDVAILRTSNIQINQDYLLHLINNPSIRNEIDKLKSGTTRKRISRKNLNKIPFQIAPIPEQRAIVAKIEELFSDLDKGIADLKKAQDQLKVYRQAVLKKAFEGELTKEWRESNSVNEKSWKKHKLGEVLKTIDGDRGKNYPKKHDFLTQGHCLFLSTKNVRMGEFVFNENLFISEEKDNILRGGKLSRNDVVLTTRGTLGNVALFNENVPYENIRINSGMLILRVNDSKELTPHFLMRFINSVLFFQQLKAKQSGTAQPQIPARILREIEIEIPENIEEQTQVLKESESRLSVCDKVEESISESLEKAKALRQSILKKAFEGTLLSEEEIAACKAAPDYEPASVLLEKIKAEKKK